MKTAGSLDKPYLRTKSTLTVNHLLQYLGRKLAPPSATSISLECDGVSLPSGLSLAEIKMDYWADKPDLVLHYQVAAD